MVRPAIVYFCPVSSPFHYASPCNQFFFVFLNDLSVLSVNVPQLGFSQMSQLDNLMNVSVFFNRDSLIKIPAHTFVNTLLINMMSS